MRAKFCLSTLRKNTWCKVSKPTCFAWRPNQLVFSFRFAKGTWVAIFVQKYVVGGGGKKKLFFRRQYGYLTCPMCETTHLLKSDSPSGSSNSAWKLILSCCLGGWAPATSVPMTLMLGSSHSRRSLRKLRPQSAAGAPVPPSPPPLGLTSVAFSATFAAAAAAVFRGPSRHAPSGGLALGDSPAWIDAKPPGDRNCFDAYGGRWGWVPWVGEQGARYLALALFSQGL